MNSDVCIILCNKLINNIAVQLINSSILELIKSTLWTFPIPFALTGSNVKFHRVSKLKIREKKFWDASAEKGCLVYSFGIDNNWKFTDAMRDDFKCEVHAFDPNLYEEEEGER